MSSSYTVFFDKYWVNTSLTVMIVYAIVSSFTVFANLLLCVAFYKDPFGELRTVQNYYILNLGIADLIMGVISEPLMVVTYWNSHSLIYFIHYLFAIISASCSLLNITALSIIRYFAVKQPFQTQSIVNKRNVLISIGVMWVTAIHYPMLLVLGWREKAFQLYLYVCGCIIPTIVFLVAYFLVYRTLHRHTISLKHLEQGKSLALSNALRTERAATRTVLLVLVVFLSLWIPFLIIDFAIVQCPNCRTAKFHLARDITLSLVYFSSGINPLIYAWRVKTFRRAFIRVLGLQKPIERSVCFWKRISTSEAPLRFRVDSSDKKTRTTDLGVKSESDDVSVGRINEALELS